MGFRQHNLSTTSLASPLARASQKNFSFFYKMRPTWPHHFVVLHVLILLFLLHFVVIIRASLLLFVLHCTTPLYASLLFMFWCSSYFAIAHHVSLLLLLHFYPLCFVVVPCASLLLLFCYCYVLRYSYYFVTMWCFVVLTILLLHGVSYLLHTLLARPCPFGCWKSSPYSICWKHLVEVFYNAFTSKSCVSIKKNVFTRSFGWFNEENKTRICVA